ncbi:loader and inhibitor of G40P protein [Fusobacterium naviforme]|nr:hypothetical protein F7P78_06830 [Fusobacterium naviforme]PSL09100.1 loader and inhibitor of G40P protein [Fusobacterium naviforme]STO27716.1 Loader and inhibitor of phage G40P [Fusobacterium naviforme]
MTEKEILQVLATLQTAYPGFYRGMQQQQLADAKQLWMYHFGNHSFNTVWAAVNRLIATRTETWPPTIGEVNEAIYQMQNPDALSPMDAWNLVRKALPNCGYYSMREYEKLPEQVRRAIKPEQMREWALDDHFNEGVASSNFMKNYREMQAREKQDRMIPDNVRKLINQVADKMKLEELDGVETVPALQGQKSE